MFEERDSILGSFSSIGRNVINSNEVKFEMKVRQ